MHRISQICLGILTLAFANSVSAAAQSDAPGAASGWSEAALEGSHFAAAMERWVAGGMQGHGLGLHLATMPGDSAAAYAALESLGTGDFGGADDASLIQLFDLFERTLHAAPVPVCSQALGGNGEQAFMAMLAPVDSATAEEWVAAFDALVLGIIAPGKVSPPASAEDLQVAMVPAMATLSPDQLKLWMRQASDPAGLTESESCEVARMVFATINRIPETERAGVLRGSLLIHAAEEEAASEEAAAGE